LTTDVNFHRALCYHKMMSSTRIILLCGGISIFFFVAWNVIRFRSLVSIGTELAARANAYEQHPVDSTIRVLFIGDSSAVGVGASSPLESVAGRLGARFPTADIINRGHNGDKVHDALSQFQEFEGQHFDLIVIQAGGNDIVRLTPFSQIEKQALSLLQTAHSMADAVILLHGGNIGSATLFPLPLRKLYTYRTARVRAIYQRIAPANGARYVDIWREADKDPFELYADKYYAADFFHPSSIGYGFWYEQVEKEIDAQMNKAIVE